MTIERLTPSEGECKIGASDSLSEMDIYRINKLYNCPLKPKTESTTKTIIDDTDHDCIDQSPLCIMWASAGDCHYKDMAERCPFSCKTC